MWIMSWRLNLSPIPVRTVMRDHAPIAPSPRLVVCCSIPQRVLATKPRSIVFWFLLQGRTIPGFDQNRNPNRNEFTLFVLNSLSSSFGAEAGQHRRSQCSAYSIMMHNWFQLIPFLLQCHHDSCLCCRLNCFLLLHVQRRSCSVGWLYQGLIYRIIIIESSSNALVLNGLDFNSLARISSVCSSVSLSAEMTTTSSHSP